MEGFVIHSTACNGAKASRVNKAEIKNGFIVDGIACRLGGSMNHGTATRPGFTGYYSGPS
jgi:hypothetical protein